jgi:ADP-dependent NAD(P)H-hydrate dehydratase / NAD(P)H-hydrate epimerase
LYHAARLLTLSRGANIKTIGSFYLSRREPGSYVSAMAIPVISVAQMREWELATWAAGRTQSDVIRRVGMEVAAAALSLTRPGERILVLAGKGNNGADAKSARETIRDREVELLEVSDPGMDLERLKSRLQTRPDLVIDGLFGIGLNRALSPEWVAFINSVNEAGRCVLSVDVPSGLNADTAESFGAVIRANITLTVGAPKKGLLSSRAWSFVGRLQVISEVGLIPCPIQSDVLWSHDADFRGYPPEREVSGHKGSFGHVAIFAGSPGYHGAAVLAARGAQRAQPGLITLYAVESIYHVTASQLQAVMVSPWQPSAKVPAGRDAILIGPGLAAEGLPDQVKLLTRVLWRDVEVPLVVDASALDWIPLERPRRDAVRVMSPHPGEAARLLRATIQEVQANRVDAVRKISERYGNAWVILKGHQTVIGRHSGEVAVNSSGNSRLAQGGSGDLLAGYITGLLSQPALRADVLKTLRFAVWHHGSAADRLSAKMPGWIIEDLAEELGYR